MFEDDESATGLEKIVEASDCILGIRDTAKAMDLASTCNPQNRDEGCRRGIILQRRCPPSLVKCPVLPIPLFSQFQKE